MGRWGACVRVCVFVEQSAQAGKGWRAHHACSSAAAPICCPDQAPLQLTWGLQPCKLRRPPYDPALLRPPSLSYSAHLKSPALPQTATAIIFAFEVPNTKGSTTSKGWAAGIPIFIILYE